MLSAFIIGTVLLNSIPGQTAEFYIDPVHGKSAYDGSVDRPWKSLQQIINLGLIETHSWDFLPYGAQSRLELKNPAAPIKSGDIIWLKDGYYGDLSISGIYNSGFITIAALKGHTPLFNSIHLQSGSKWVFSGLHVSPGYGSSNKVRILIKIEPSKKRGPLYDVIVEDCILSSAANVSEWTAEDWNRRVSNGIYAGGTRITLRRNQLTNINHGITVTASLSLIENNTIENFAGDGIRGLGDHGVYQYNLIKNCYDVNDNHDDGFQSWSRGPNGESGLGTVTGIVLRGNTIINYEDPNQPHLGKLQGIGCFDGDYTGWVVENNVVVVDHWHGITLRGAHNCRIFNNTVVDRSDKGPGPPWIKIDRHKDGRPSTDCIVRNNLVSSLHVPVGKRHGFDHNLIFTDPQSVFKDFSNFDFRLKQGSQAIDAGIREFAPDRDILGVPRPQGKAIDIGAYENIGD